MSKMIEVPDALLLQLERAAAAEGFTPGQWIDTMLPAEQAAPPGGSSTRPRTMADRLAGRLGRIGSGTGEPSSASVSDSFADYLLAKQRAGHL